MRLNIERKFLRNIDVIINEVLWECLSGKSNPEPLEVNLERQIQDLKKQISDLESKISKK